MVASVFSQEMAKINTRKRKFLDLRDLYDIIKLMKTTFRLQFLNNVNYNSRSNEYNICRDDRSE